MLTMLSNEQPHQSRTDTYLDQVSFPARQDLREIIRSLQPVNHSEASLEALLKRIETISHVKGGSLRIGMYDGSFDPPHRGHVETAHAAILIGRLDLLVINCHPKPSKLKPNLSPHPVRTKMLSSYFQGAPLTIISPLSRAEIERALTPHPIVGVIGSDTFNRFLKEGIAPDFKTDEIFVSERHTFPLTTAPARLEGRPVWYLGRTKLAYNDDCSTSIRLALINPSAETLHPMINQETADLAREHGLYADPLHSVAPSAPSLSPPRTLPSYTIPESYRDCAVEPLIGLENGLLSESFVFQVRGPAGTIVAFMKMLSPERNAPTHLWDEANGLALFNRLGLTTATAPECIYLADPPSLWVARAPGETPASLITKYDRGLVPAEEVYRALFAVGAFLRELHTRHSQPFDNKGRDLLETYIAHHQAFIDNAIEHELPELKCKRVQQAIRTFDRESNYLRYVGLRCSLIHGDASCTNFLWDTETQRLSVIDLQRLGTQARTGAVAFSTFEYRSFFNTVGYFPNIGFPGVRGGLEGAVAAFNAGYGPVDRHENRFFRVLRFIRKELGGPERIHEVTRPTRAPRAET